MARASGPRFFATAARFRAWLEAHHETAKELLVGFRKKHTGKPSLTWHEAVGEALCFGWIDGVRTGIDEHRYTIRFTPRRATSIWSAVNIKRVGELESEGRMRDPGRAAFARRRENRSGQYSYEQRPTELVEPYRSIFRQQRAAYRFFEAQAPSYRRACIWWIVSAKLETTRAKRLERLIEDSAAGRRLEMLEKYSKGATRKK